MKKLIITFIFIFLVLNIFSNAFDHIINGEYAFYQDSRGNMNFIRGYCIFKVEDGSVMILVRNINKKNNKELNLIVQMETDEKGEPEIKKINGLEKRTKPEFTQSYVDILNYISLYNKNKKDINYDTKIKIPWEDYNLFFIFNNIIPVFRFKEIFKDNDKKSNYYFLKGGKLNYNNYKTFFTMNYDFDINDFNKLNFPKIENKTLTEKKINDVNLKLDDRWKTNNELGYPGFWLEITGKRDSQIMIEKGEWKRFQDMGTRSIDEFIINAIYNQNIIPNSIKMSKENNEYNLEYLIIDKNKNLNISKMKIFIKNKYLYIVNFSSFYHLYEKNVDYYKLIFDSIKY